MRDLISFLTQIPVGKEVEIEAVIARIYLFPVVGLVIGLIVAVVAFFLFGWFVSAPEIAALLTLLALYLVTGLLHLDGLADFFDGVMAPGSKEEKKRAMKDNNTGIAGLFAAIFVLLASLFAIKTIGSALNVTGATFNVTFDSFYDFAAVFIIAEVSAKLSMNTCLVLGRGFESSEGLGKLFIQSFSPWKYLGSFILALLIALLFTASFRFVVVFTGVVVALFVTNIAKQKFGAISGDVMGASNELARCATLIIWTVLQTVL